MSRAGAPKYPAPENEAKVAKPIISSLLDQFEQREAGEFQRRTGLDYKTTIAEAIAAAEPQPGMRVLDVATGTGVIARQLVAHVGEKGKIIGIDATEEMVQKARLAAQSTGMGRKIEWRVAPAESLPFDRDEFDLITCTMSFPRLRAEAFLKEAYRVLKPDGRLLIATELAPGTSLGELQLRIKRSYRQLVARNSPAPDLKYHSAGEVGELIRAAGFRQCLTRILRQPRRHATLFALIRALK
ncbi:MAG TPA: methyltransferase domain-containing protein [Blastocatellia bacterium]|nr:methyltransferase domain-containing protein [Blastocatellia bacterium]